jgi:lipopolysaccharide export LptBFGC system permease protein LptF
MKKQVLIIALAIVAVLTSCSKSQEEHEELLAGKDSKSWQLTDYYSSIKYLSGKKDSIYGEYKDLKTCFKDNFITYKANRERYYDEGVTKCDTSSKQNSYGGKWIFENNYKTLNHKTLVGDANYYDVIELTSDKMILRSLNNISFSSTPQDSFFTYLTYKAL